MDSNQKQFNDDHLNDDHPTKLKDEGQTHFGFQTIATEEKVNRVGQIFSSVAERYDLMNDLMSFGLHRIWKRLAIARASVKPHYQVLDLAGGTGDLSIALAKQLKSPGTLFLADINHAMLNRGRARLMDTGIVQNLHYVQANAECLPFPTHFFHCITMGFGLRNVTNQLNALKEMFRVLKPGGRVVILEFSKPNAPFLNTLYDAYSFTVLPALGKMICNDRDSYQYLAESIRMHPDQETLKSLMEEAGFQRVDYQNVTGGIVAIHVGFKL